MMLKLYVKTACPYCVKAKNKLDELNLEYEEKNVSENQESREELMRYGGKFQAPFLIDERNLLSMYESDEIIRYAETHTKDGMIVCHTEHCQHEK